MNDALDNLLSDFRYSVEVRFRGGPGSTICEIFFGNMIYNGHGVNAREALERATENFSKYRERSKV